MTHIHNKRQLNEKLLYLFFNNYERDGVAGLFGRQVRNTARQILDKAKSDLPVVSHVGFLFYDDRWKIADLDYYAGGLVIREVSDDDIGNFNAICPILKKQ